MPHHLFVVQNPFFQLLSTLNIPRSVRLLSLYIYFISYRQLVYSHKFLSLVNESSVIFIGTGVDFEFMQ